MKKKSCMKKVVDCSSRYQQKFHKQVVHMQRLSGLRFHNWVESKEICDDGGGRKTHTLGPSILEMVLHKRNRMVHMRSRSCNQIKNGLCSLHAAAPHNQHKTWDHKNQECKRMCAKKHGDR
jgi:hypothetical protein